MASYDLPCEPCSISKKQTSAAYYCQECDEDLCSDCLSNHKSSKATKTHVPLPMSEKKNVKKVAEKANHVTSAEDKKDKTRPGEPFASDIKADSLNLTWEPPEQFEQGNNYYQVSYKDLGEKSNWKFWPGEYTLATAYLDNLKSNSEFVFRVRVVYEDGEGSYSPESKRYRTVASPASRIIPFAKLVENSTPKIYGLPTTEIKKARNNKAKTKKLEVGSPAQMITKERTIMLVGATGTGKSLLVDGLVNYVLGVNWSDPYRFTVVELEQEEKDRTKNQALSQTEWISCYTLNPEQGSRLDYRLNVIDTPGFGDTRGLTRDQEIVEQIRQLFSESGVKGIACLDAVCFLIKAPDARLTAVQTYIFHSIMALFGKDIEKNICSLITFADGKNPPVHAALDASGLPFGQKFNFNNSGVFASNANDGTSALSPMFWAMGMTSFKEFFKHLDTMQMRSLTLTKDVLNERFRMEATIRNIQPKLNAGLTKVDEMKQEIKILEDNKLRIKDNANFEYEVEQTQQFQRPLPQGQYVTNCTPCTFTCHESCAYADNSDKAKCCAMGSNGYCTVCPKKCYWNQHANTPHIFDYKPVKVKRTYSEMQAKYQEASGKLPTQEQVVRRMTADLNSLCDNIEDMMEIVKDCNKKLKDIALRPNPLSMTQHIDMMIEAEKLEQKPQFQQRITILQEFRQRAEIAEKSTSYVRQRTQSTDVTTLMSRMVAWFKK